MRLCNSHQGKSMRYLKRDTDKKLGANIAKIRKDLGISQVSVAEQLGISKRALSSYEHGTRSIPIFLIPEMSEILRTPLVQLLDVKTPILDERTREARILRELEKVKQLPKDEQKLVFTMIDSLTGRQAVSAK